MFDLDKWQEITAALQKNKLRTFLTGLGVMFGILILVTLLALGKGFENKIQSEFGDFAKNSTVFWTQKTTKPYKGFRQNRRYKFTNSDLTAMRQSIYELEHVAPEVDAWSGGGNNTFRAKKKGSFTIRGTSPEMNSVNPVEITGGRFFNHNDIDKCRKVVTIGPRVKDLMFEKDEEPVGQYLKINSIFFKIIGTIKPLSQNMGNSDDMIQMPFTTLQNLYNRGENFYSFIATAKIGESVKVLEEKIFSLLARRHKIAPDDKQAIGHFNIAEMFNKINGLFTSIGFLLWVIGFGVLITGIIGVSNIMLVIVKERTREIGVKRAIGAKPLTIVGQIINESIFLTSFAGFWGLVLGVIIVEGVAKAIENSPEIPLLNPYVDIKVALIALGALIIFGCIAGLLPAQRAIKIKPIDALRYE